MKVVISAPQVYPFCQTYGGVEKTAYSLAKYLAKEGIDVKIFLSSPNARADKIHEGLEYHFITPESPQEKVYSIPTQLNRQLFYINLARQLKREEFDVLHAFGLTPYYYLHFKRRKPVVFQSFEEAYIFYMSFQERKDIIWLLKSKIGRWAKDHAHKYCFTKADAIAFFTDSYKEEVTRKYKIDEHKFFYLPFGIDISLVQEKLKEEKKVSRKQLGISEEDFVIISVNRIHVTNKGIDYLIDALELLRQEINNIKLILIGTGPDEKWLYTKVKDTGLSNSVIHLRNINEQMLYNYYALSNVYVCPILEDFSVGILEAMACGLPVVSTCMDYLVKPGVNGYIVPKRDAKATAEALLRIHCYEGSRKAMSEESQNTVKDYDWAKIAKIAMKKYENLVKVSE